jgi:16S rRNA (guanine527-N7)-methyltransferase
MARPQEGCLSRRREPLPTRAEALPPLPPEYTRALDDAARDLELELSPDARRAIDDHVRLLIAWNDAINLTAIREPRAIALLHVADSLSALRILRDHGATSLIDLGSGGGYPGLPLAIALPTSRALLVDSVGKKAAFLETAAAAVGAADRVAVASTRAEALATNADHRERWAAVTSRAVGSLADAIELGFPLVEVGGIVVTWKRRLPADELAAGRRAAAAIGTGALELVPAGVRGLDDHVLVVATKGARTNAAYPRDPAERRRRPW